jgi:HPt (histidine-containing phosphotransfer) domain-containing protein
MRPLMMHPPDLPDSVLDPDIIEEYRVLESLRPDAYMKIAGVFFKGLRNYLNQIEDAERDRDALALRQAVHGLGGASGTVGAIRLHWVCRMIQTGMDKGEGVEAFVRRKPDFERELEDAKSALIRESGYNESEQGRGHGS